MRSIFKRKKENADQHQEKTLKIKAVYVMAFTPEKLDSNTLMGVSKIAGDMLKGKDANFKQLEEQFTRANTPVHISNLQYSALMHTPQTMQTTLAGWLKGQYQVQFHSKLGINFFPHGMKDPQGRENYVLFYFDLEKG